MLCIYIYGLYIYVICIFLCTYMPYRFIYVHTCVHAVWQTLCQNSSVQGGDHSKKVISSCFSPSKNGIRLWLLAVVVKLSLLSALSSPPTSSSSSASSLSSFPSCWLLSGLITLAYPEFDPHQYHFLSLCASIPRGKQLNCHRCWLLMNPNQTSHRGSRGTPQPNRIRS